MKIIIAGSRTASDFKLVQEAVVLSEFEISEVVSGTAIGADRLGECWAECNNIPIRKFPADWHNLKERAGYVRNYKMGEYADGLIAIWDEQSKGTKHMIGVMMRLKKPIYIHPFRQKKK